MVKDKINDQNIINRAHEEAWEFAMICLKMDGADFYKVFGSSMVDCLTKYSYQDAKARYDKWKKEKII